MICEPCGKEINEPSAVCASCYLEMRDKLQEALEVLETLKVTYISCKRGGE